MNSIHSTPTQSSLLEEGPEACLNFIRNHFPLKYDWLSLAERATTKATSHILLGEQPFELGLSWIRVAVALYEMMASHLSIDQKKSQLRLSLSAIALRVKAIEIWGVKSHDNLLNPENIINQFHSLIEITPLELQEDMSFPRTSSIRDALEIVKYVEPLLKVNSLNMRFPEISDYHKAACAARQKARTRFT